MDLKLAGKVALITGSSRGIGLATATALAAEGCRLMLSARSAEPLAEAAAALCTSGVDVAAHPADVSKPDEAAGLVQAPAGALPVTPGQLGLNHFAVQVESLADLKEAYEEFQAKGVRLDHNTDHGMTSSMYFFDPDGNRIEYFCNNQDDPAVGLVLMGDVTRQNKALVLS